MLGILSDKRKRGLLDIIISSGNDVDEIEIITEDEDPEFENMEIDINE